jgi:hypothetical protein
VKQLDMGATRNSPRIASTAVPFRHVPKPTASGSEYVDRSYSETHSLLLLAGLIAVAPVLLTVLAA